MTFFRLPESPLVEIASRQPAVYAGDLDFVDATLEWYDDWEGMDQWLVEDGPDTWPRTGATTDLDDLAGQRDLGAPITTDGVVSNIVVEDERISFDTTAVGEPHLVRVSYFPAWRVEGADGPYRAAPSLMVVVPDRGARRPRVRQRRPRERRAGADPDHDGRCARLRRPPAATG